jgi:hypothetical protein
MAMGDGTDMNRHNNQIRIQLQTSELIVGLIIAAHHAQ